MTSQGISLQQSHIRTSFAKTLLEYFFAFSLSVLCTILVLQLWKLQWLYIPFVYTGDENLVLDGLAHFNLSAVLLATMGEFSSLLAFFALTGLRSYNRISVFIGFFVLAAFFIFLQKRMNNKTLAWGLSLCLLELGFFNQTTKTDALPKKIKKIARVYQADQDFFQTIEQRLPPPAV